MGNKLKYVSAGVGIVMLVVLGWAITLGLAVLAVFMLVWNITDIQNSGISFWPVAWIVLASIYLLGLLGSILRRQS